MMELPNETLKSLNQKVLASKVTFPQASDANPELVGEQKLLSIKFFIFTLKSIFKGDRACSPTSKD